MSIDRERMYHARRAYEEAVRAIRALSADAEASHDALCRMHCRRFLAMMEPGEAAAI